VFVEPLQQSGLLLSIFDLSNECKVFLHKDISNLQKDNLQKVINARYVGSSPSGLAG
jgi:hypothetical protein